MKAKSRAFTFLELVAVTALLALIFAMVAPRLLPAKESSTVRRFFSLTRALFISAREDAVSMGTPVTVRLDNQNALVETRADPQDMAQQQTLYNLPLPSEITVGKTLNGSAEVDSGNWSITFQPDGTCLGGGIEFNADGNPFRNVSVRSSDGAVLIADGQLEPKTDEKWQAGEHEIRN